MSTADPELLVFLDETGAKTNMTRTHARSRRGQRQIDHAPLGHWNMTTLVAAVNSRGPIAPMVLDGPMNTEAFVAWVEQMLVAALPPGAIVVMDNLSPHHAPIVEQILRKAGAEQAWLPPYSPDFNPIELMWSKVKEYLRSAKARTQEELWPAMAAGFDQVEFFHNGSERPQAGWLRGRSTRPALSSGQPGRWRVALLSDMTQPRLSGCRFRAPEDWSTAEFRMTKKIARRCFFS